MKKTQKIPPIVIIAPIILLLGLGLRSCTQGKLPIIETPKTWTNAPSDRLSEGGNTFFLADGTDSKKQALESYRSNQYNNAEVLFAQSLKEKPNDPEGLIYYNNLKAQTTNPIKIAVSVPGDADLNGSREILRGVAQAQQEINTNGGINGRPLGVVIAIDNNEPKEALKIARTLVKRPDILGVVGHYASSVSLATAETYNQGQLVAISPISSAVQLSNKSPYLFRTVPSDYVAARSLTEYMLQTLRRKNAVVYFNSQSDYSKSLKGEFSTAIALQGGQIVTEYDLADPNFGASRSLAEAKSKGAEVIMLASSTSTLDRALQVARLNNRQLPMLGGDDLYSPSTLDITREKGQDMVIAVPWHILASNSQGFATRSRKLWGGDVNWRTVTAYDATQALAAALQSSPTRSGVQQALKTSTFVAPGASRPITFLPSGDRNVPVQLVKIVEGERSTYGYDFMPIP
jgi:branched-chain amino acid transport system substrate-binding protein